MECFAVCDFGCGQLGGVCRSVPHALARLVQHEQECPITLDYLKNVREGKPMIDRSKYFSGEFVKPADIGKAGASFTIAKFEEQKTRLKDLPIQPVLWLEGVDKPFPLNATNLDAVVKLHGKDETKWPGKKITIIHTQAPNPSAGMRMQDALRIKL